MNNLNDESLFTKGLEYYKKKPIRGLIKFSRKN